MSIDLHPGQSDVFKAVFEERNRTVTVNASRGWGKSYMAAVAAVKAVWELMELDLSVPNKNVYIIAPTHSQATEIYYPLLNYELGMEQYAKKSLRSLGKFIFSKHVELRLASYESIERLRGKGAYFVVNDEMSSWLKAQDAVESIIQPCINTRWSQQRADEFEAPSAGRMLTISTPKGYNYFYDAYMASDRRFTFDYKTSPYLDVGEIEKARHNMDPIKFASEYLAQFKESGNSVFYMFNRDVHVTSLRQPEEEETIHAAIDFNVGKQCTSFWVIRGGQLQCIGESMGQPDTEQLALTILGRYDNGKRRIICYPDPTGRSKKTSAKVGTTDFTILENTTISGYKMTALARGAGSIGMIDSVAAVNKQLLTAAGDVSMYIDPSCRGVIKSLERTKWVDNNSNTATIDKTEDIEHYSDGIRYLTEYLFPVLSGKKLVSTGFGF